MLLCMAHWEPTKAALFQAWVSTLSYPRCCSLILVESITDPNLLWALSVVNRWVCPEYWPNFCTDILHPVVADRCIFIIGRRLRSVLFELRLVDSTWTDILVPIFEMHCVWTTDSLSKLLYPKGRYPSYWGVAILVENEIYVLVPEVLTQLLMMCWE